MRIVAVDEFLRLSGMPVADVRSPGEYAEGHIPGAVNIPLFSNQERAQVGTTYKQISQKAAIREGLEIAGQNMSAYLRALEKLDARAVRLHCWRGGMRSEAMAWLFDKLLEETFVMKGGYKAYRQAILDYFRQPLRLAILTGNTGSGKTRILRALREYGEQVIDLEGLANHQGSSFGYQKTTGQPTTEQFQNNLFEAFRTLDRHRTIWLEDESFCIGCACMPEPLFHQMQDSPRYLLKVPKDRRLENILEDYGKLNPEKLVRATHGIAKKLGKTNAEEAETLIGAGRLREAAAILLTYYDKRYAKSLEKNENKIIAGFDIKEESEKSIAKLLIDSLYVR